MDLLLMNDLVLSENWKIWKKKKDNWYFIIDIYLFILFISNTITIFSVF